MTGYRPEHLIDDQTSEKDRTMTYEGISISTSLADLKEDITISTVKERLLSGDDPVLILDQCQEGIVEVGRRYETGEYYISGLIMAGEIMRQVSELLLPVLKEQTKVSGKGKILLATVQSDIHFIGKNIFKIFLQCSGYDVKDVGTDVDPEDILKEALAYAPEIIGLSCLISTCYDSLHNTVQILKKSVPKLNPSPYIIIGGNVDQKVSQFVGADGWADDAMIGLRLCQRLLKS